MRHTVTVVLCALVFVVAPVTAADAQQFGPWPEPVHLDWGVNTDAAEFSPMLSRDGLTLHWLCLPQRPGQNCSSGPGYYVAHRPSRELAWGTPIYLGDLLGNDVFITIDGHRAYFGATTEDGKSDLYVSKRRDQTDDFGWGPWESLGSTINTPANEYYPGLYEDKATGVTFLYFTSDRAGNDDIYASVMREDGTFDEPTAVVELNTDRVDRQMKVRRDGLECVLMSNRWGSMVNRQGLPSYDIWIAKRSSTSEPWSEPVNAGENTINTGRHEGFPSYSFDGSELYFHGAQRVGNFDSGDLLGVGCPSSATCYFDIWVATREKLTGSPDN